MAFQFRFQRVLDVREREEDLEKVEFARVQNRYRREVEELEKLKQKLENHYARSRQQRSGQGGVHTFVQQQEHTSYLMEKIQQQQEIVDEWEKKMEEQREELVEASQRRQVMETLRENDYEAFQKEQLSQERREGNEVANRQYYRDNLNND